MEMGTHHWTHMSDIGPLTFKGQFFKFQGGFHLTKITINMSNVRNSDSTHDSAFDILDFTAVKLDQGHSDSDYRIMVLFLFT